MASVNGTSDKTLRVEKRKKNFRLGRETFSYQCTRGISAFSTVFHPKLQSRHDYIQFTTFSVSLAYTLALSSQLLRNIQRFLLCCFTWQNNIILPKSIYQPRSGMVRLYLREWEIYGCLAFFSLSAHLTFTKRFCWDRFWVAYIIFTFFQIF